MDAAMHYSVRVAVPGDSVAVNTLLAASYPTLLAANYERKLLALALPLMTKANFRLLASGTYYVAEMADDKFVGCGGWTAERPGSGEVIPGQAHIRHFATHPDWTRRGIGSALVARVFDDAKAQGIRSMQCFATLGAESFYWAHGFTSIGPAKIAMTGDVELPVIWMRRELS